MAPVPDVEKSASDYQETTNGKVVYRGTYDAHDGISASALAGTTYAHNTGPTLRVLGNPGPLGLYCFASTTFILSMVNIHARGVTVPNVVVGMTLFVGGLGQFLAGMWEFAAGNTYGATLFGSFGGFWLSYAAILIPGSGIGAAYAATPTEEPNAIGIYLAAWVIATFLFLLGSLRVNIVLIATLFFLDITFILLMIGEFTGSIPVTKAGGWLGLITAALAYYLGSAQLYSADNTYISLPVGVIKSRTE